MNDSESIVHNRTRPLTLAISCQKQAAAGARLVVYLTQISVSGAAVTKAATTAVGGVAASNISAGTVDVFSLLCLSCD